MKWMVWLICLLWPLGALAEDLQTGAQELIEALDLEAVARAADGLGSAAVTGLRASALPTVTCSGDR